MALDELDEKAIGELAKLSAADAIAILDQFERASAGIASIRNKSAYLHGWWHASINSP